MRFKVIRFVISILFAVIALELFYLQIIRGNYYFTLSKNNRIRIVPFASWRGRIMDRNSRVMADNEVSYNVMVTPQDIKDIKRLFNFLSEALQSPKEDIVERYRRRKVSPFTPVTIAEGVSQKEAFMIEENRYRFPSIYLQQSPQRIYPQRESAAHVLGYVGKIDDSLSERTTEYGYSAGSIIGYAGIEKFYDTHLRGKEGGSQIEVNSRGEEVRLLSLKQPVKGEDIILTIDSELQEMGYKLLAGKVGSIVILDIETGGVLALINFPSYDPNIFTDPFLRKKVSEVLGAPYSPLLNRAIKGLFPPGSVFKVLVSIAALDTKTISPSSTFVCPGSLTVGGKVFRCTHAHGLQDMTGALAHSCNVYYYHLALKLGPQIINKYAQMFGLGQLTRIDLPFEAPGQVAHRQLRHSESWFTGDTLNLAIGQGETLTTPLQLVSMMATIAREGKYIEPHMIKSIRDDGRSSQSWEKEINIDKNIFKSVKKGLRLSVINPLGTAHVLDMKDIYVAGKTGTAQTFANKEHDAWFVGYVYGRNRKIALGILLEHGGSSLNACLLAKDLLVNMADKKML